MALPRTATHHSRAVVLRPAASSARPENLGEMHILGPHPDVQSQNLQGSGAWQSVFSQAPAGDPDARSPLRRAITGLTRVVERSIRQSPLPGGCIKTTQKEKIPFLCTPLSP